PPSRRCRSARPSRARYMPPLDDRSPTLARAPWQDSAGTIFRFPPECGVGKGGLLRVGWLFLRIAHRALTCWFARDLLRKPVPTLRDHAPAQSRRKTTLANQPVTSAIITVVRP